MLQDPLVPNGFDEVEYLHNLVFTLVHPEDAPKFVPFITKEVQLGLLIVK